MPIFPPLAGLHRSRRRWRIIRRFCGRSLCLCYLCWHILFVVRPVQKQALSRNELNAGLQPALAAGECSIARGWLIAYSVDNAQRAAQLKMQAFELVRQKPMDTARAMQAWMREEKE